MLTKNNLDELGLEALNIIEQLSHKKVSLKKCEAVQTKLRAKLPKNDFSPYSVLIWALMPHTGSYPIWYSAGIAGLNLSDLEIATLPELTKIVDNTIKALSAKHY